MRVMINLEGTDNYNEIEINDNLTILDLKAYASSILNIAWNQMDIVLNNRTLSNNIIIRDAGIGDNVIVVKKINPPEKHKKQTTNLLIYILYYPFQIFELF